MRWNVLLAAGCLLPGPAVATAAPTDAIVDFALHCERATALWGKRLCGPIALVDPQTRATIVSVDPRLPGFSVGPHGFSSGTLPDGVPIANTAVELGGRRVAEVVLPLPDDRVERRILLAHESFHRIQPTLGFALREADNGHLDSRSGRIDARLEMAALKVALRARHWKTAARDALSFRARRLASFPGAGAAETSLINNEGLAEYTGIRVGARGQEVTYAVRRLASGSGRPSLIRSFGYVVGPAYGLLLDRVSPTWRDAVRRGRALPDLLRDRIGMAQRPPHFALYGGAAIAREEASRDEALQQRRTALRALLVTGPTMTFPFQSMRIAFNPNALFSLGPEGTVYGTATTITDKWGSLEASGTLLLAPGRDFARVPGPAIGSGDRLSGPGWTARLAPGYRLVSAGPGRQTIER